MLYFITPTTSTCEKSARLILFFHKKRGALGRPFFCPMLGLLRLEGDPQPQPHGAPVVDALLREAADQAAEIGIGRDIRRVEREQLSVGLIHPENETAKPCERAATAAGISVRRQEGMIEYVVDVRA